MLSAVDSRNNLAISNSIGNVLLILAVDNNGKTNFAISSR